LLGRLFVAKFRVTSYFVVFVVQVCIYLGTGRRDKVGDAIGYLGRGVTDAIADIFRS